MDRRKGDRRKDGRYKVLTMMILLSVTAFVTGLSIGYYLAMVETANLLNK